MASHAQNSTETTTDDLQRLDVLGDECSRTILVAASDRPLTAKELTSLTDCSSATVYRRINTLLDLGLLRERIRFDRETKQKTAYETTVGYVGVGVSGRGVHVTTCDADDPGRALAAIEQLPFEHVQADVGDDGIDVHIELEEDTSEESRPGSAFNGV